MVKKLFEKKPNSKKPANYREITFQFTLNENVTTTVVALACPDHFGQDTTATMEYLKNAAVDVICGLEVDRKYLRSAENLGLKYVDLHVADFTSPSIEQFDIIYDQIIAAAGQSKRVAIHCKGGNGRTGTVLVALKLKEMSLNSIGYEYDDEKTNISTSCSDRLYPCSKNVQSAILAIRSLPGNRFAVESDTQIEMLCKYDLLLNNKSSTMQSTYVSGP